MKQASYTKCVKPLAAVMARTHVVVHRASGRRFGRRWRSGEVAMLSTTGRRTGQRRTTPLVCLREGADILVVASNGGSDRMPDWWLNLQHWPYAEVELNGRALPVVAERAPAEASALLLDRFADAFPFFDGYRSRTERLIPVVVLRPARANVMP